MKETGKTLTAHKDIQPVVPARKNGFGDWVKGVAADVRLANDMAQEQLGKTAVRTILSGVAPLGIGVGAALFKQEMWNLAAAKLKNQGVRVIEADDAKAKANPARTNELQNFGIDINANLPGILKGPVADLAIALGYQTAANITGGALPYLEGEHVAVSLASNFGASGLRMIRNKNVSLIGHVAVEKEQPEKPKKEGKKKGLESTQAATQQTGTSKKKEEEWQELANDEKIFSSINPVIVLGADTMRKGVQTLAQNLVYLRKIRKEDATSMQELSSRAKQQRNRNRQQERIIVQAPIQLFGQGTAAREE